VHDLGDSFALGSAWHFERLSHKSGDVRYSYGYKRFSLAGALFSTIVLLVGSVLVLSKAVPQLIDPQPAHATGMAAFAIVGVVVNGLAVLRLRGQEGLNIRVAAWHLMEDVLGWMAVLAVGVILMFTDLYILDPALSIIITLYILYNVLKNLKSTMNILLQGTPEGIDLPALEKELEDVPGVQGLHHAHVWTLEGTEHIFTCHAILEKDVSKDTLYNIKHQLRGILRQAGIEHTTIEFEYPDQACGIDTSLACRNP